MTADLKERHLGEAGYERAAWRAPTRGEPLPGWNKWVVRLVVAVGACFVVLMVWALNNNFGPYQATARMERILAQLEDMPEIRPETAQVVMRVIGRPGYDCEQVACDHKLAARNLAVRSHLITLTATTLADKSDPVLSSAVEVMSMRPSASKH
jgi:hypothetical protein